MKKITFADRLDDFLHEASEQEVRDVASTLRTWARWKNLPFKITVEDRKMVEMPLLDEKNGDKP